MCLAPTDKKKHAPTVYLKAFTKNEKAYKAVTKIDDDKLCTENGLDVIFTQLDTIYKGEEHSHLYRVFF